MKRAIAILIACAFLAFTLSAHAERMPDGNNTVITLYGYLTGKTILRPGELPKLPQSVMSEIPSGTNENEAPTAKEFLTRTNEILAFITDEFDKVGVAFIPHGESFVLLLPKSDTNDIVRRLSELPLPTRDSKTTAYQGTMNFEGADVNSFLQIYSGLRHRTVLRSTNILNPPIYLRTQTKLTKDEANYAMSATLILNHLAVIDDGDKFVQIVADSERGDIVRGAPKPDPTSEMAPTLKIPPGIPADALLKIYAGMVGKESVPSKMFGTVTMVLNLKGPMTKAEIEYAIQTLFTLNHLKIVPGTNDTIQLAHM